MDLLRQVKEYKRIGYDGTKMYEGHPNHRKLLGYSLDDEIFDPYYDYFIEKCGRLLEKSDPESLDRYNLWCMKNDFEAMKKGAFVYDKTI